MNWMKSLPKPLLWVLFVSFAIRALLAAWIELGNDEVYYWTYALYPDWSHFDHPPMVGWMIQLFSLNLLFDSELFLRMSSVVLMTVNTLLIFEIGSMLKNSRTGFYAALLYNASVYAFVITGIFILPDTPQNFFWLLAILQFIKAFSSTNTSDQNRQMLLAGFFTGLAMLSKYTSVFLWFGVGIYVLIYRRNWLKSWSLYASILLSIILLLPLFIWNLQNDFISLSFQSERISLVNSPLRLDLFFTEIAGQLLYNNPINVVLTVIGLIGFAKSKFSFRIVEYNLLLFISLPLILIFLFFALFRATLPHWTSPAYVSLIFFAAAWLDEQKKAKNFRIPIVVKMAMLLLFIVFLLGALQIKYAIIPVKDQQYFHQLGKNDVTLDMFGWRGMDKHFGELVEKHENSGEMPKQAGIIGDHWFPLAHIDYYIARPLAMKVFGLGKPQNLHKYMWINRERGNFQMGADYWYITNSRDYQSPDSIYSEYFKQIVPADTITISRRGIPAKRYFVFLLKDMKQMPDDPLSQKK